MTLVEQYRAALEEISVARGENDDNPPELCEHCLREFEVCDEDERFVPGESRCPGGIARRALAHKTGGDAMNEPIKLTLRKSGDDNIETVLAMQGGTPQVIECPKDES